MMMPRYEVTRSYTVICVATVEADTHDHAEEIACDSGDIHWKEYDGDYDTEVYVEEIEDEDDWDDGTETYQRQLQAAQRSFDYD
jgi:hypothetical protein